MRFLDFIGLELFKLLLDLLFATKKELNSSSTLLSDSISTNKEAIEKSINDNVESLNANILDALNSAKSYTDTTKLDLNLDINNFKEEVTLYHGNIELITTELLDEIFGDNSNNDPSDTPDIEEPTDPDGSENEESNDVEISQELNMLTVDCNITDNTLCINVEQEDGIISI